MSFLWIIGVVISMLFYVAKSVEKQNAQERERRQRNRKLSTRSTPSTPAHRDSLDQQRQHSTSVTGQRYSNSAPVENVWMKKYKETAERMNKTEQATAIGESRTAIAHLHANDVMRNQLRTRATLRQAFIFSECIGKPRALEPHRVFSRKK
ncbi:hypothetical protein ACFP7A_00175 [Sporolactobacillus kofuensis]|uniref:Uncharacterized protein n=1 Tax=Sporolactobacillus kofuensis TaxID=269672 RepID=A0ABW1W9T7_9BACL|nr:hypothetical protein [Sporolactobacillus kofuensis]MCO7175681.1 hypothetical protein [Sporolactobacillus kofuensis]